MKQKEMKLVGEKDIFFGYFKKKIISCLSDLENGRRIQKAHGYAVGTVRTWKGKEYIKTAPGKWRRKHSGETRGAKLSVAALKRKADKCTSSQELLQLVLENKSRFTDGNGHPLPFVKELSDYVSRLNDVLETSGENGRSDPKKELTLSDSQIKYLLQKSKEKMNDKIPSKERYLELFSNGVDTPIGKVKMGENQYEKFVEKGREYLIESAYRTLKAPAFIFNENDTQIFVKSFEVLGGKDKNVISVIITRDGNKISISTHERKLKEIINKAKKSRDVVFTTDTGNAGIQQVQNEQDANPPDKSGNNEAFDKPKASGKQLPKGTSQPDNSIILQGDKKSRENEKKQELYSTDIGSKVPIAKVDVNSDGTFSINADSKTAKVLDAMMKARRKDGNGPSAFYFVNVDKKNNTLITSDGRQLMAVKVNGLDKLDSHTDYLYNVEKKGKSYVFVATKETGIMPYQKVTPDAKPENNIEMNSGDFYSALAVCEQMSKEAKKNGRSEEACLISVMDGNAYVSHYDPESEQYNFMKVGTSKLPDCHRRFSIRYLLNSKSIINGDNFNFNMPMPISEEGSGRELAASISTENLNFIVMPKIVEGEKVAFPAKSLILDNVKNPAELLAEMKAKKSSSKPIKKSFSGRVEDFNTRFLNGYVSWRQWNHMKNDLLKSRSHKYVKRVPKTNGKGYRYFYAKDFKTPFRSLLNFFGIGKARIEKDYEGNHIEKDFGVSKSVFAQHVLHYFLNKAKWDKVFSGTKQKEQKKNSEGASSSGTEKKNPTEQKQKQKTDQPVYFKALMRRIYSIYNRSGQKDPDANEHDNRSRAMLGKENAKKLSSLTNEDKQKIRISLENVISSVRDGVIVAEEGKKIIESSKEWVEKNFTAPANTDIGEVFITKSGIANSLSHGFGKDKLKAIPSIKDVLEKGCYIGYEDDFGGKPLKNHYFAGRVQFPNGSKIVFCRVRESKTGGEKHFYVHEIFTDDVIKKGDSFKTGLSKNGEDPGGIPLYLSILQDIFGVNSNKENKFSNEHDNRSRAMLGNENAKKEFSSLSEGEKIEKGKAIKENIVCKIEKDSVPYNGDGMYDRAAAEWVKNNHQTDAKTIIGNVIINKKSVVRDMHHGEPSDKYIKLQTLPAIKSVLEKGVYIGYEKDFNGENIDNHYFAGKVQYGDEDKIIFCRVRETAGDTNRFYVHEVFTDEEIKKEADNAVTDGSLPLLIGKPLYKFILQDVLNVKDKTENISNVTDKEREAAGYPKRELFERYSAVDDATWDPKSKEYRYRDTGYIAGARKELAAGYLISAGKNRARVKDFQIDWEGLEENPRMAEKLIVKSNIFGEVNWDNLKDNGMSGSAAFLVDRIFASAGAKPEQTNPEARRNYVIAVNGMRDRLESCKTVEDVLNVLREIRDERNGIFLSVRNTPEYMKMYDEYCKVIKEIDNVYLKSKSLERATIHAFFVAREKAMKLVVAEAKKNGHLKPNQKKLSHIQDYNLFSKYTNEASEIAKKDEDYIKAAAVESDFKKQSGLVKLADKRDSLQTELKELEHQHALKALKANPLHQAWIQLGKKFNNILRSPSFLTHVANARRGKYDDWQWSQKSEFKEKQTGAKRKAVFELEVASVLTRKGGRNVKAESTQELKDAFRLRDVQSGNWVLNDPESAKFHVDNLASGFADLADMTGIADAQISLNGRLAMAIGARGAGGNAKAHYEPVERVINITKMKGGGSLAHEWFHAFDNLLTESMTGGHIGDFLTNPTRSMPKKKADIFNEIKSLLGKDDTYSQYRLDRKIREAKNEGMDIQALLDQDSDYAKVRGAFDNLTKAMLEGNIPIKIKQNYTERDYRIAKVHFDERTVASSTFKQKIVNAGSLDKAVEVLSQYSNGKSWIPIVCAYYDKNPQGGTVEIPSGKSASSYYIAAQQLESGSKPYWSTPHEMAARAFSAYVDDKLREKDRHNDYLAYKTSNRYYRGGEPYPSGDERKKINGAFDNLFRVVKETNAIRKALSGWLI